MWRFWTGLTTVCWPVERAVALSVEFWYKCYWAPGRVENVFDGRLEVSVTVTKFGFCNAGKAVPQEACCANAAEAICVADCGVGVVVGSCNMVKAGAVALPGGAARLVPATIVVVQLVPVEGAGPGDIIIGRFC